MIKKILVVISIVIILLMIGYGAILYIDYHKVVNGELPIFANSLNKGMYKGLGYTVQVTYYENTDTIEKMQMDLFGKTIGGMIQCINESDENKEIVVIEDGNVQNENKIDEFMDKANNHEAAVLEINIISNEKTDNVKIEFIQGEYDKEQNTQSSQNTTILNSVNIPVPSVEAEATLEEYQKVYGYYKVAVNNEVTGKYDIVHWKMKRDTKDNIVKVIMEPFLISVMEMPVVFEYSLESSSYEKKFDNISYFQRKDLGIEKIAEKNQFDNTDFAIYTYGGDVSITVEGDMVYFLEDALTQKIITAQDLLEQVRQDEKYGFCEQSYYSDGGSIEYRYPGFTILKYNTLHGNKDMIFGMQGTIINQVNEELYT